MTVTDDASGAERGWPVVPRVAVVGLGYVGLPLALGFAAAYPTLGFDVDPQRVAELRAGHDRTREVAADALATTALTLATDPAALAGHDVFIVAVPTPVDAARQPDLSALLAASRTVGAHLRRGSVVIFESTVFPGCTEEVCVPVLEEASGLRFNQDFFCGYSPERANPGDQAHRLKSVVKVTSGSTPAAADLVDRLYRVIIPAGTHRAPSIRVAEAAKVIENTQRDVNIALVNEIAIILARLGIDTADVLAAAGTKWNFLPFRPGLVGGHCIGVDPYYLTHRAQVAGYHPEMILAGRRLNDGMGAYVAGQVLRLLVRRGLNPVGGRCLVLGLAFKEDCPDIRNSGVASLVAELAAVGLAVEVHDPWVDADAAAHEHGIALVAEPERARYDVVVLAVRHRTFVESGAAGLRAYVRPSGILYDVQSVLAANLVDGRL